MRHAERDAASTIGIVNGGIDEVRHEMHRGDARRSACWARRRLPSRRKSSSSGGSRASTRPRTTRSTRRSRSSRQKTGVKVELSQYAVQDMIPKTVAALDAGTPPDVAYADVYDFQVTGKWAFDGKLEDISRHHHADEGQASCPNTIETTYLLQRQDEEARVLRVPDQAADDAHRVLEGHARARRASRNPTSRRRGRSTGTSGATRCSRRLPQEDRQAHLRRSACRWASTRATRSIRS